jgi:hypothetical protein
VAYVYTYVCVWVCVCKISGEIIKSKDMFRLLIAVELHPRGVFQVMFVPTLCDSDCFSMAFLIQSSKVILLFAKWIN